MNLKALFSKEALLQTLKDATPLHSIVMDTVFTHRPKHPFPLLRIDEYADVLQTTPLIRRGGMPVQVAGGKTSAAIYEPFSLNPMDQISGAEMNDLKALNGSSLQAWRAAKTDKLRRIIRKSTEGMCAAALSGTLKWPTAVGSGYEDYQVEFGTPLTITATKKLSAADASLIEVLDILRKLKAQLAAKGYGSKVVIWAGEKVFSAILKMAFSDKSKMIHCTLVEKGIQIGSFLVEEMTETYTPPGGKVTAVVADDKLIMVALDAGHALPYCSIDDLDGNQQALPFFIKAVETKVPSGFSLVAESKPFPLVNVNGIATCTAV